VTVKRFVGNNSRDAMRQVRTVLGDDALILANRSVAEGIEILAVADEVSASATDSISLEHFMADRPAPLETQSQIPLSAPLDMQAMGEKLLREMQDMRALLAQQQARTEPETDLRKALDDLLSLAGFGRVSIDDILTTLPEEFIQQRVSFETAQNWLRRQLLMGLPEPGSIDQLLEEGGPIAFVGPTGVGKTTTTAKLAARYVMRHGPEQVALVSTDSYRVGAHEQLRIYAELLGVTLHALAPGDNIVEVLESVSDKRLVLIDTVGLSQRDSRMAQQIRDLQAARRPVRLMLLLSAASEIGAAEEVVDNYYRAAQPRHGRGIECILTKLDEAVALGQVLDITMRHGLQPLCVTAGQRVPEDIEDAEPKALVERALQLASALNTAATTPSGSTAKSGRGLSRGRALSAVSTLLREHIPGFTQLENLWVLGEKPEPDQQQLLDEWLDRGWSLPEDLRGRTLLWQPPTARGHFTHPIPDLVLGGDLNFSCAAFMQYRQPADPAEKLTIMEQRYGVVRHLFASLPDSLTSRWLDLHDHSWCCPVRSTFKVLRLGKSLPVAQIAGEGDKGLSHTGYFRGQEVEVLLSVFPVTIGENRPGNNVKFEAQCWSGELRNRHTGEHIAEKYWLSDRAGNVTDLLLAQLAAEPIPALTRRVWDKLERVPGFQPGRDLRLLLAASLAGVLAQVDRETGEWGIDLRSQLQRLSTDGNNHRAATDVLLHLLVSRELFAPQQAG